MVQIGYLAALSLAGLASSVNAQYFNSTSSSATSSSSSATPSATTGLGFSTFEIVNSNTGSDVSYGTSGTFLIDVALDAEQTGSIWFTVPDEFGTFPSSPFDLDFGTVSYDDTNNFTVDITSVPSSGQATFQFTSALTSDAAAAITGPESITYTFDSSSGSFTSPITYSALPTDANTAQGVLSDGVITFSVNVPVAIYPGRVSIVSPSDTGYTFDSSSVDVYFVGKNAFNDGTLTAVSSDFTDSSSPATIIASYDGDLSDDYAGLRFVFKADVSTSEDYYKNTVDIAYPDNVQLAKRDVHVVITSYVYPPGVSTSILAPTTQTYSDASSSTTGSATGSATGSTSGSATGSATGSSTTGSGSASTSGSATESTSVSTTVTTSLSTTIITTCTYCAEKTTAVAVSTATVTENGVVTEYTTYCPLTALTQTKVSSGVTAVASVVVTEVESNIFTVYTTYCPLTATESETTATAASATTEATGTVAPAETVSTKVTTEGSSVATVVVTITSATGTASTAAAEGTAATEGTAAASVVSASTTVVTPATTATGTAATGTAAAASTSAATGTAAAASTAAAAGSVASGSSAAAAGTAATEAAAAGTTTGAKSTSAAASSVTVSSYEGSAASLKSGITAVLLSFAASFLL